MTVKMGSALLAFLFLFHGLAAWAQEASMEPSEADRRKGFYQHRSEEREADIQRERGLREFLREEAEWEVKRQKDRKADQNRKKQEAPGEESPEYRANLKERLLDYEEHERNRKKYVQKKKSYEAEDAKELARRDTWAIEELGLDEKRPRYDVSRRALFGGGKPLSSRPGNSGGGGSSLGGNGGGNYSGGSPSPSFPEPQYPEFDGYVPPPPMPDPGGYFPPPDGGFPPPPTFPGADDGGFYPPPPPPPEGFGTGF